MSIVPVNVGTTGNDGTGDPLRTAFQKVNTSVSELGARTYDTRAAAIAATIPSIMTIVRTGGYSVVGDRGQGIYKRRSGAPTLTSNPFYFQSADGAWWELVPQGGEVFIEQFGGKADSNGAGGGTDNKQPLYDAVAITAQTTTGGTATYKIRFGAGSYRFSGQMWFYTSVAIEGVASGYLAQAQRTLLDFPENVGCFTFHGNNTGPTGALPGGGGESDLGASSHGGASGSSLRDLSFIQPRTGAWLTTNGDATKSAIFSRTTIQIENISIYSAPGNGVKYRAYAGGSANDEGNSNQWSVRNLFVHSCKGDAFWVQGADVNGGCLVGLVTHTEVGGCGIRNESYLPNAYYGMQITGYGNKGVNYLGKNYVLVHPDGGKLVSAGGTTPGTDNHKWYYMGDGSPTSRYLAWVDDGSHHLQNPIYDPGTGSQYFNPYIEADGTAMAHVLTPALISGGNVPATIYSSFTAVAQADSTESGGQFISRTGLGSYVQFINGSPEYVAQGSVSTVRVGGMSASGWGTTGGLNVIRWSRSIDGGTWAWEYTGKDIAFKTPSGRTIWEMTTAISTQTLGRGVSDPDRLLLFDPMLRDPSDSGGVVVLAVRSAMPTNPGLYAQGDIFYNKNAAAGGFVGWVCTTIGAIHEFIWTSGVSYGKNAIVKTAAGRYYRNRQFGAPVTTEPTHLSGEVQTADGYWWTYIANSAPVFKTFGAISA